MKTREFSWQVTRRAMKRCQCGLSGGAAGQGAGHMTEAGVCAKRSATAAESAMSASSDESARRVWRGKAGFLSCPRTSVYPWDLQQRECGLPTPTTAGGSRFTISGGEGSGAAGLIQGVKAAVWLRRAVADGGAHGAGQTPQTAP